MLLGDPPTVRLGAAERLATHKTLRGVVRGGPRMESAYIVLPPSAGGKSMAVAVEKQTILALQVRSKLNTFIRAEYAQLLPVTQHASMFPKFCCNTTTSCITEAVLCHSEHAMCAAAGGWLPADCIRRRASPPGATARCGCLIWMGPRIAVVA